MQKHPLDVFKYCPRCGSNKFMESSPFSKKCEVCSFEYYKPSAAAVIALIFDEKGNLLITRRKKEPSFAMLDLPGGFVDLGETIEECAIREVKEETNIDISVEKYLFSVPNRYPFSGLDVETLDFVLKCKIQNKENIIAEETEISDLYFSPINELNLDDFGFSSIKQVIKRLKKHQI